MIVNSKQKLPIKIWMNHESELESGAWDQVKNLANFPFAYHHIALMPDAHQGFGMPIGGVLATQDVIVPNAVGVDIGCGMCAVKTDLKIYNPEILKEVMGQIRQTIPVGFNKHQDAQNSDLMPDINNILINGIVDQEYNKAKYQIGTLGGGNHFIEIQKDVEGFIWIMIHSGSRNLGKTVADFYNKKAVELNEKYKSSVPQSWGLSFLPINSEEGQNYIKEMNYCVEFALANRKLMMERAKAALVESTSDIIHFEPMINIPHNYAELEYHFGKNVWVHRKGATLAREGTIGLIPGSQGTKSYVVKGLGNPDSFESCSHGSGRKMSRRQARETLSIEEETKRLDLMGVVHAVRTTQDLDEAPGAYKDIDEVMDNQTDLVTPEVVLLPLAVVKG